MSRSRDKGNRLERVVANDLHTADGVDERYTTIQTSTGRVGNAYHLEVDIITRRFLVECKNRESIGAYLWEWLDHIPDWTGKWPLLVIKRNRRQPLVVMRMEDFVKLLEGENER